MSEDGTIAFADIELPGTPTRRPPRSSAGQSVPAARLDGLRIEYGGQIFGEFEPPSSELLGLAFAIVILILAFGSVLGMGLPIGVALGGIGVGTTLLLLLSNVVPMPEFAATLGIMIGLGVGIDYALFIVTRYREQLRAGHTVNESVAIAIDTSGRAVTFAGLTVVISLMGMLIMGVGFVNGLAIGSATIVAVTMVASLTLLPALLGFVGARIEVTRWRGIIAAGLVVVALVGVGLKVQPLLVGLPLAVVVLVAGLVFAPLKAEVPRRDPKPLRETPAYRWSRMVQARPWPIAIASTLVLLLLAVPVLSMRLGFSDDGNRPADSTTRQAYDLLSEGFGPGSNGPLLLVTELDDTTTRGGGHDPRDRRPRRRGVRLARHPERPRDPTARSGGSCPPPRPRTRPPPTSSTAARRRPPAATEGPAWTCSSPDSWPSPSTSPTTCPTGSPVLRRGAAALVPPADGGVPLAAGAAEGRDHEPAVDRRRLRPHGGGVPVGLGQGPARHRAGPDGAVPADGALRHRVRPVDGLRGVPAVADPRGVGEHRRQPQSVADGLAATAKVITAAAAIMVFVFGSFLLEADRTIKLMGFGLATAVFLDATIVRMLLVPATMELLGEELVAAALARPHRPPRQRGGFPGGGRRGAGPGAGDRLSCVPGGSMTVL